MTEVYKIYGQEYRFNDSVDVLFTFESDACGRLIQVRKNVGQYGSDIYLIRRKDGSICSFENAKLNKSEVEYPACDGDSTEVEYTIKRQFPETGFIIETPKQPQTYSPPFVIGVTKSEPI